MSNLGQAALIVVGTVVGAYFGNPQLGFVLGSLAGSALFPTQLPNGPRITDNRTTTATIGLPIPIVFGTCDVAGTIIWLAPFVEHSQESGGKGGPQQKVFSYTQSIAIALCERVDDTANDDIGAIGGLTRIWENGEIVYDIRPQQGMNTALDIPAESDIAYANRLSVSATYAESFTLYLGDELQAADPTIEATEGFANVPAFRGLAYIVYPDRNLRESQGIRHPNFTFEVYSAGTGECVESTLAENEKMYPWIPGTGREDPSNPANTNTWAIQVFQGGHSDAYTHAYNYTPNWGTAKFSTLAEAMALLSQPGFYNTPINYFVGYRQYDNTDPGTAGGAPLLIYDTGAALASGIQGTGLDTSTIYAQVWFDLHGTITRFRDNATRLAAVYDIGSPPNDIQYEEFGVQNYAQMHWVAGPTWTNPGTGITPNTYPAGNPSPHTEFIAGEAYPDSPSTPNSGRWALRSYTACVQCVRTPAAPPSPCAGLPLAPGNPGYAIRGDGLLIKCTSWAKETGVRNYKVLQAVGSASNTIRAQLYPLDPCIADNDPLYTDATFWTAAYNAAVTAGHMPAGLSYSSTGLTAGYPHKQNFAWRLDQILCEAQGQAANVGDIIRALCKRAGMIDAQIDTGDVSAISIGGYSISNICDAADCISPLRSMAFFDCVESGTLLKFSARGKPIVATFTTDDFGCYDASVGASLGNVPPSITVARADETTLPRQIRLHYKSTGREYQDAEADSPFRLTSKAVDDQDISIPLCLGDVQAAQAAEILWSDAWAAQNSYTLSIDQSWLAIEAGDCIAVPVDGFYERLRIVSTQNASGILRKLSCVRDNEGAYISFAVAQPPAFVPPSIVFLSATVAEFLNLPALKDADNDAGIYVAVGPDPAGGNTWRGATIYQSVDGVSFSQALQITQPTTFGTVHTAVPISEAVTWDDLTDIIIDVPAGTTLESRTDDAVLLGANAAAIGADGRWEIVQYANATQLSTTQWMLSRLLRGRRGTEHVMGSSQAGDAFVFLSSGSIGRIPLSVAQIGGHYTYKVVTNGSAFSSGVDYPFTSLGSALIPFSPTDPAAHYETSGDILISWIRRDRLGQTLVSGMDIPLSDYPEKFEVDLVDHATSPAGVFRTLTSSDESVVYSAADFAADYGGASPNAIHVRIYQISQTLGRGTPLIALLDVS